MNVLGKIEKMALAHSARVAFHSRFGEITYGDMWEASDRLAAWIDDKLKGNRKPIVVYGHKSPLMLVCFLACAKSGRAYCPVDISMPAERVEAIINKVDNNLVLATEPLDVAGRFVADSRFINICMEYCGRIEKNKWNKPEDIFYIIFTSGSTGEPKGVQITDENLSRYTDWSQQVGDSAADKEGGVFLNQAPFSFDLSVMDLYTGLTSGCTLWSVDKKLQSEIPQMLEYMQQGGLNYWVSTPSFADMCLAEPGFNGDMLPELRDFFFCGEKLTKGTARGLMERFPKADVINTYGPTESTVAVTSVKITDEMLADEKCLPIGEPKPGTEIRIIKSDGSLAKGMEHGEIQIVGNTVSPGYYKNDEKTSQVFDVLEENDRLVRSYMTGDEGFFTEDGMLHYVGRIDLQVKLHGYRIELGDIETNLLKINGISAAAVVPKWQDSKIRYLAAFVVNENAEGTFEDRKEIKTALKRMLPEYMVPKKVSFIDRLPLTNNGKADRKKLEELV